MKLLYESKLGLKPIKAVRMYENYRDKIDEKFHEETCLKPSDQELNQLKTQRKIKIGMNSRKYNIRTKVGKDFGEETFVGKIVLFDFVNLWYSVQYDNGDVKDFHMKDIDDFVLVDKKLEMIKYLNMDVQVKFGEKWFSGMVKKIDFSALYVKVFYEDGDIEELNEGELKAKIEEAKRENEKRKKKKGKQ